LVSIQRSPVSAGDKSRPSTLGSQRLSGDIQLAVSLPRRLDKTRADLVTAGPAEAGRLSQRAKLIRGRLAAAITYSVVTWRRGPTARIALFPVWAVWPAVVARCAGHKALGPEFFRFRHDRRRE
jgi:hypothetical protein